MKLNKLIAISVAVAAAAISMAQFPGGGRGGMMRMGGGAMLISNPSMLLQRDDVKKDVKITDDQATKLAELQEKMMADMQGAMAEAQGDRDAMRKAFTKMGETAALAVGKILTPEQSKRLRQIAIQLAGNAAANDKSVAKEIGITDAQKTKLDALNKLSGEASQAVMAKARAGEIQWSEMPEIMKKNSKALNGEIAKILTETQKTKLKELGGEKFEEEEQQG